jgi:hypothetical protein
MSDQAGRPSPVSIALLHHPVYDKNRQVVATAVTNLDIHDIARAARTYGIARYYLVTPVAEQQDLAGRIVRHWQDGWGATYNPKRQAALSLVQVADSLAAVQADMSVRYGVPPCTVVTGARGDARSVSCSVLARQIQNGTQPVLLVFGTGWGLTEELFAQADLVLEPLRGPDDYHHLSVRSAVAIYLDRLFGRS